MADSGRGARPSVPPAVGQSPLLPSCTAVGQLDAISQSGSWRGRNVAVDGPAQPMRTAAPRLSRRGKGQPGDVGRLPRALGLHPQGAPCCFLKRNIQNIKHPYFMISIKTWYKARNERFSTYLRSFNYTISFLSRAN